MKNMIVLKYYTIVISMIIKQKKWMKNLWEIKKKKKKKKIKKLKKKKKLGGFVSFKVLCIYLIICFGFIALIIIQSNNNNNNNNNK